MRTIGRKSLLRRFFWRFSSCLYNVYDDARHSVVSSSFVRASTKERRVSDMGPCGEQELESEEK